MLLKFLDPTLEDARDASEDGMVDKRDDRSSRTTLVLSTGGSELMVSYYG